MEEQFIELIIETEGRQKSYSLETKLTPSNFNTNGEGNIVLTTAKGGVLIIGREVIVNSIIYTKA